MKVCIRLQRAGAKSTSKRHNWRVVAIPLKSPRHGRALEILGYYDPDKKPAGLKIELDKLDKWLAKGAQMSDTVRSLVKKQRKSS